MMDHPVPGTIRPEDLAYDIDGVVADTMEVFVRLARERYQLDWMSKECMVQYNLQACLGLDRQTLDDLICLTLDDEHTLEIPPMPGAPQVLTELSARSELRFVTARIWPESITEWIYRQLPAVPRTRIRVIATGSPDAKTEILRELGVHYFVEDRLETCRNLATQGFYPLLFDQPWNRSANGEFPRIMNWEQLRSWVCI
jgi:uncharacterized HAD superfamily protein